MTVRLISLLICLMLAATRIAAAQDVEAPLYFSNKDAEAAIRYALHQVPKMKCGKEACAETTPEELAKPPVEVEEARLALMTGARSARLKWCGLEWAERAFIPMMRVLQQRGVREMRNLAILQVIHGAQLSRDFANLQALKTCTKQMRADLDTQFPKFDVPPWQRTVDRALLDESVADMLQRVLSEIEKSVCGDKPCEPATDEEKASPPLTIEEARRAMKVGLLSGTAEYCGLDWRQRIFLPFMAHHHRALNMSARQLTIVSMLHGTMQGYVLDSYNKSGTQCTEEMRQALERQLSRS